MVQLLIDQFGLQPHPEGGWYAESYKSKETIPNYGLPKRYKGDRAFSTCIYFLLEKGNFSAFHKIQSDECWHFYSGDPMNVFVIRENGEIDVILVGNDITKGHVFQYVVPANCWFASRPAEGSEYCFVGCTVAPGFEFTDFELADAEQLSSQYPQHKELINSLCW